MQSLLYDLEKQFFLDKAAVNRTQHLFITGLARSGTTSVLNLFYSGGTFASLAYEDMPFILSPNLWSKVRGKSAQLEKVERAHGDEIFINLQSPEAFEEVFWKYILQNNYIHSHHLEKHTVSEKHVQEFENFIQLVLKLRNRKNYLSKNNNNILRLNSLSKQMEDSIFLIIFRDPLNHARSLLNTHNKFIPFQEEDDFVREYMNFIGHNEFGLDHKRMLFTGDFKNNDAMALDYWLELWCHIYGFLEKNCTSKNVRFVCYEDLCENPESYLRKKVLEDLFLDNLNFESLKNKNKKTDSGGHMHSALAFEIYNRMRKLD
ncbi:MAG: sulfotransferase [Nitrospinota bacterium]